MADEPEDALQAAQARIQKRDDAITAKINAGESRYKKSLTPLEQVEDLKEKVKNATGADKVAFQQQLKVLQRKLRAIGFGPKQRAAAAKAVEELEKRNAAQRVKDKEDFEKLLEEQKNKLARGVKKVVPSLPKPKPKATGPSDAEKLAAATNLLSDLQKQEKPKSLPSAHFSFPQFTEENSTTIVVGCLVVIAVLELSLGTKFVELWNFAFSPKTDVTGGTVEITGGKPTQTVGKLNLNPLGRALGPGTVGDDWGIPSPFDYIEGAVF